MKPLALVKAIPGAPHAALACGVCALAILLVLYAPIAPAQTEQQLAEIHELTETDWTNTLDYGQWLLNAQFWFDHSDSQFAKDFFAGLNLSPADDSAFRSIVRDFTMRHDQLMADSYAKLDTPAWTPEDQTKLTKDLVNAANDAIQGLKSNLTPDGANNVNAVALGTSI
jgi:hypothetical protein